VLVLDDLMIEASKGTAVLSILTRFTHHNSITVFLLTQNIFYNSTKTRDLNSQAHYTILYRNSRDKSISTTLARQLCPHNKRHFVSSFADATRNPFSYLIIDCHPTTPDEFLLRTNLNSNSNFFESDIYLENDSTVRKFKTMSNSF